MTEADWLACKDPEALLAFLGGRAGERKLRLFTAACCRKIWPLLTDERSRRAVETTERYADGLATGEEMDAADAESDAVVGKQGTSAASAAMWCAAHDRDDYGPCVAWVVRHLRGQFYNEPALLPDAALAGVLRCLFNPFGPASLDPAWLTADVRALARGIDQGRKFEEMPVLGDALEDAGCTDQGVLEHCREGDHARGCWLLDLVLGRA
jgi:hypothetical protein